jgi:hypothetical protein
MKASIGYYANTKRYTKVHVVKDGKPICGMKISSKLRFQWCAYLYSGVTHSYVECEHCKKKLKSKFLFSKETTHQ